jgi:hypothetical protein
MLVVALAAVSVWGVKMWRVSGENAAAAQSWKSYETRYRKREAACLDLGRRVEKIAAKSAAMAVHYAALARKYERAARYPWLPVEPDPPELTGLPLP